MKTADVGELLPHSENLDFLIESDCIDVLNPDTLLVVELVLEVLNVKVLQLGGHVLDELIELVVLIVHGDDTLVD